MVTAGNILRPSSPLISVDPSPGKKISAQSARTIKKAWNRFTAAIVHEIPWRANLCVCLGFITTCIIATDAAAEAPSTPVLPLPKPRAEHVILCVWDGMRPDFITKETTPVLYALSQEGTFFANNHSHYITTTEVNGTVLATGVFPRQSSIIANREYRPDIDLLKPVPTEDADTIRAGDKLKSGKYIDAITVAEAVQGAGGRTVVAGTKPVALLHDRTAAESKPQDSVTLYAGKTQPRSWQKILKESLGKFPPYPELLTGADIPRPNTAQNLWTTRALTEVLWKDSVPKFTVFWLGDPDFSQHLTCPGSPTALQAIADSDRHLGMVLDTLKARGLRDKTDIIVVSDHGFSTVSKSVDISPIFAAGGLKVVRQFRGQPQPDEILAVTVGGSCSLYIVGHSKDIAAKAVQILQSSEFAGPIFTREKLPGTFSLADGRMDAATAPDIVFALQAIDGKNQYGAPGLMWGDGARPGSGTHGTLGKSDVHNTLVAAGPDIRKGFRDQLPTGNIDVAPTLFHLLGLTPDSKAVPKLDGRILVEALADLDWDAPTPEHKTMEATTSLPDGSRWTQTIQTTHFLNRIYFDQGASQRTR